LFGFRSTILKPGLPPLGMWTDEHSGAVNVVELVEPEEDQGVKVLAV
jgi:hypothetical protein